MAAKDLKKPVGKVKESDNTLEKTVSLTEEIRAEAQKIYEDRLAKNLTGDESSDWLKAEAKIMKRHKSA